MTTTTVMDFVSLEELYVHAPGDFVTRNIRGFAAVKRIPEEHLTTLKGKRLAVSTCWLKRNMPDFKIDLEDASDGASKDGFFKVQQTLEKYKVKTFNPMKMRLDASDVKYFDLNGARTPYFTTKGLLKIKVMFNDVSDDLWRWFVGVFRGEFGQVDNLENVKEMVKIKHAPLMRKVDGKTVLVDHVYDIQKDDVVVDFKRLANLKHDMFAGKDVRCYTCPLFDKLRSTFETIVEHREQQLRDVRQEKEVHHLRQELEREKSLREQAVALTASFVPRDTVAIPSCSPQPLKASLKPSKIR